MLLFLASSLVTVPAPWTASGVPRLPAPDVVSVADGWEMQAPRSRRWRKIRLPTRRLWRRLVIGKYRCWSHSRLPVVKLRRTVVVPTRLAGKAALHLGAFAGSVRIFVDDQEVKLPPLSWYQVIPPERLRAGANRVRLEVEFACWQGGLQTRGMPRLGPLRVRRRGGFIAHFRSRQDGTHQPYSVYLPPTWTPGRPTPVLVGLHGQNGDPTSFVYMSLLDELDKRGWVGVFPHARGSSLYLRKGELDVHEALDEVRKRIDVDHRRVYVLGFSMGGTGSLTTALRRPHVFAAVAAYQSDARFDVRFDRFHRPFFRRKKWFRGDRAAARRYSPERLLYNALHVPLMVVQGTADSISPAKHLWRLRYVARRVRGGGRRGRRLKAIFLRGLDHEQEVIHRTTRRAFALFDRSVAPASPKRVTYRSDDPTAARAYWLTLKTPLGRWAHGDVSVDRRRNRIRIHSARAEALVVDVDGAWLDPTRPIQIVNRTRRAQRVVLSGRPGVIAVRARRRTTVAAFRRSAPLWRRLGAAAVGWW